jgi:hypothetical protein
VLVFDPSGSSKTTEIAVSAGTTMGRGLGAASLFADSVPDDGDEDDAVSGVAD